MPNNAIVSYLPSLDEDSKSKGLPQRLSNAIKQYQLDSDVQNLKKSYIVHLAHNKKPIKFEVNIQDIVKGFSTFNIAPSHSYSRYMSTIKNKTDVRAIFSDWEAVGEDLSSVWAKHIIDIREQDE